MTVGHLRAAVQQARAALTGLQHNTASQTVLNADNTGYVQAAVQQAKAALENPALVGEPRMHAPASTQSNENLSPNPGFDMGAVC